MSDALLTLLQWCLLALVYLFFLRVLQATWYGALAPTRRQAPAGKAPRSSRRRSRAKAPVRAPAPAPAPTGPMLAIVAPPEVAGLVYALGPETTIGRAAACDITLDDTYASQVHARLSVTAAGAVIEDLGSTNGTYHNRQRLVAPALLAPGDVVQIGSTIMELR